MATAKEDAKDLSDFGKKSYYNADKNNRGLGSAGVYPKNWDNNVCKAVKPRRKKDFEPF